MCALAAICTVGCTKVATQGGGGTGAARHNDWTVPGVLRVGFYEDMDTLNPVLTLQSFVNNVEALVFSGLVQYTDTYGLQPDAASEVPTQANGGISKDGRTITYHLRHNLKFSDGAPLTSADVKYTWQQIMNPANNTPNRVPGDQVESIETPDPYTVVVHLKQPSAPFVSTFILNGSTPSGAILPKHLLDKYRDLNKISFNTHPVGSGPFTVNRWEPGSVLVLEANPLYWRGPPKLKEIQLRIIPNQNSLLTALRTHEVDFYFDAAETQYGPLKSVAGVRVTNAPSLSIEHIKMNCRSPWLRDVNVRRAVAYGIDWGRLARDVYLNLGVPAMADVPPRSWAYNPAVKPYPHDPRKAMALLTSAGFTRGPQGIFQKNGQPLKLTMVTVIGISTRLKAEELVQQELRAVGIDVTIRNYPANLVFATYAGNGILTRGRYDMALVTMDLSPDPDNSINFSPDQLPPVGQNRSFYVDPDVGKWEAAGRLHYDIAQRRKYYWLIQQRIHDALPIHGIVWRPTLNAINSDLQNFKPGAPTTDFWNAYEWSI
ncbi:MAG: ABC transporter substrate-binding protein [Candidatus Eremiobacter antarcticus]|nr:peptide ABC transporter substrate-binding protein [Candidatus Eremiobacteraeota bacterium]MBC5807477.1 peptide ABC transporter substrate-binding protein [Candidatus Eremiobacteraeota bacterium]